MNTPFCLPWEDVHLQANLWHFKFYLLFKNKTRLQ